MHLNSIKIKGFKSFAEEVVLELEPGITTIVGPNGCGKSNVSDAIRWVLGEKSARALRCTNMRDLLFNGGAKFNPSQKASVTLSFANISEDISIGAPEVEVSRQLSRDGESIYLINQTPCRLRDITELFMDTGIGVDAYSVMEQSKIDLILNVRPEERRFLFDEVAGITKYKHNKKIAERKLEATQQNLVRINDIIQEAQRDTETLSKQAEQAKHYQEIKEKLQQLELGLACREYEKIATEYQEKQSELDSIINEVTDANQLIQEVEERIENANNRRTELDDAIKNSQEEIREIENKSEKIEREIVVYKENQLNIQQQRQRAVQTLESLNSQITHIQTRKKERIQEEKKLEATCKIEESRLTARKKTLEQYVANIKKSKSDLQEAESLLQETTSTLSARENKRLTIEHTLASTQNDRNRLQTTTDSLNTELKTANEKRDEIQRVDNELNAKMFQLDTRKKQVEETYNETQDELRKLETELSGLQSNLGVSSSRYKSLEQLHSAYEGYYSGVRAIMRAKQHFPEQFHGINGVVAELISTKSEYEIAIEVALGSAIQNVVAETAEDAKTAINFLKKHRAGIVKFLPLDTIRHRTFYDDALLDKYGVIGVAEDLVEFDKKYDIVVQQLLGNTLIIEDFDAAIALKRKYNPKARLVTLDGELFDTTGAITGGHSDQKKTGLLTRANELDILKSKITEIQISLNEKDEKRKTFAATIANTQQEKQQLTTQLQNLQIEKASLKKDLELSDQNISQLEERLTALETEHKDLQKTYDISREEQQNLNSEIEELTKKQTNTERRINRISEQIEGETQKHQEILEACQSMEVFLAGQRQRLESIGTELKGFDDDVLRIEQNIREQQAIIDSDEQTKQDISDQIAAAQREFLRIEGDRAEAEAEYDELSGEKQTNHEEIESLQTEMRSTRRKFEKQNRKHHQLEMKTTQLEMQLKSISKHILDKYQVSIDEIPKPMIRLEEALTEAQTSGQTTIEPNEIDLLDNIEKLKAKLSAMGTVNQKAIQAFEEHQKRINFLETQREDIQQSIESAYQAIKKINKTSQDKFLKTFEKVKVNFQDVFTELFGGGETELKLTDEDNVLESGVEIIARPPGKRPQSITQLSGGERSLVAIGLLFAVFKIKPSPFCVLDEVDAALDEANVLRFTNLIRTYSDNTQFVIITHNNRTMEIADVFYGVTMEQAGMSKIVSTKFQRR